MFLSLLASVITLFDDDILAIMILIFLLKLSTLLFFSINTILILFFFYFSTSLPLDTFLWNAIVDSNEPFECTLCKRRF